jgi:DNA helicase II / ATP-dependent DNA helicase PcrA
VLVGRIAYMVEQRRIPPATILAITFTTVAAATLRQRLAGVLGQLAEELTVTTFHALGLRLIKQWSGELGFGDHLPAVYGRDDARAVLREAATGLGLQLAPELRERDPDPWAASLPKLDLAVERFRLGWRRTDTAPDGQDDFDEELLGPLTEAYEALLQERGAVDYPSMLRLPLRLFADEPRALHVVQDAYRFVMADEAQDTSHIQFELLRQVVERHRNLAVVGDPKQCFPPGTLVQTPNGPVAIESLKPGHAVVAAKGHGETAVARVQRLLRRDFEGDLVQLTLRSGRVLRLTPQHMCFARLGLRRDIFYVYLMYRRDLGYRVGTAVGAAKSPDSPGLVSGIRYRSNQENADKAWVLRVCSTLEEALFHEQIFSVQYGLLRVVFKALGRSIAFDQASLTRLYAAIDTRTNAARLMADLGLHFEYPHHRPQAHLAGPRTRRLQVNVTLFAGNMGGSRRPWRGHIAWLNSSDRAIEKLIQDRGVSTRAGSRNTWRVERQLHDVAAVMAAADELGRLAENPEVARWALLSEGRKFSFQPASHLHRTMIVPVVDGDRVVEDEIISVERTHYSGRVYDLDVEHLHNYVAGGMVVHNCIYSWNGADPRILLSFPQLYPEAKVFPLDQNHRSTGVVVALSNALAAPLEGGHGSWTNNVEGPRARIYGAVDELDEARFVAAEIDRMLRCAELEHPGQVAVLFRTNAQARVLALSLRAVGVPFRARADADLFAQPEVRDMVAYLRLAHCPTDGPALARVVNVPPRRLRAIEQALRKRPVPPAELPLWAQKRGGPAVRRTVEEFLRMLDDLHRATLQCQPVQVLQMVLRQTKYDLWLASQKDGATRLNYLKEMERAMESSSAPDLATWLVDMHLGEIQGAVDNESRAVTLSTIHSAKGGEWPVVFVTGLEEGLLPHLRPTPAGQAARGEDEERRLAYVAFSRTQVLLYLVYCQARRVIVDGEPGRLEPRRPSRFLRALPSNLVERVGRTHVA